jgi:hypothetical protein
VPVLHQALRDLSAWVERGVAPPPSTNYRIDDGQVIPAATAAARHGVQPVVTLTADGGERADVRVGQTVRFRGTVAAPPGAGTIVGAAWDLDASGTFARAAAVPARARTATVALVHRFDRPGTYFIGLKGSSERHGDRTTPYARIENLARVRVVVSE